jgi:uncharacterized protein (TIRG00374 family)
VSREALLLAEEQTPGTEGAAPETEEAAALELPGEEGDQPVPPERLALGKRILSWRTILPLVAVVAVFVLAAQHLRVELDPATIASALSHANIWLFLAGFAVYYGSFPLRVFRWKLLLVNAGYGSKHGIPLPSSLKLLQILYLSWFANVVVPAKLGDVYRAYLLRQEARVSTTRSFGTVLAERILDLIALLLLFISALLITLHGQLPDKLELALRGCLVLVAASIGGLVALRLLREKIGRLVPARFREHYVHFQEGTLGSFKRLHVLAPLTVAIWSMESLRFMLVALATGLLSGSPLHIFAAARVIAQGEWQQTPVPLTPRGGGVVEAGMFAMILLFTPHTAAAQNAAGATIVLDRIISLVSILVVGGVLFFFTIVLGKALPKRVPYRGNGAAGKSTAAL